jgi:hypothetical protein
MEFNGIRPAPVLVAAIATYAVGFVIYGLLVPPETWMQWSGISQDEMDAVGMSRMPFSPVMPLMIALGTALAIRWRGATGVAAGAATGFLMALFFLVGGRLYGYVYGVEGLSILALDVVHLLLNGVAAGAVLGAWPAKKPH